MTNSYLLFRLAERLFGVRLQGAIEILPWRPSRKVPLAYSYIDGIMDYRGAVYPVFNLTQVLGITRTGQIGFASAETDDIRKGQSIILLQTGKNLYGIIVDSVVKMISLDDAPGEVTTVKGINTNLITGVRNEDGQDVILLSFERLFHAG